MRGAAVCAAAFLATVVITPLVFAGEQDAAKGEKTRVTLSSKAMSDKEMDRVSAGDIFLVREKGSIRPQMFVGTTGGAIGGVFRMPGTGSTKTGKPGTNSFLFIGGN